MAECAQCMFENPPEAASCEQCGADLAVEALSMQLGAVCRGCDSYNDPGVRICVSCGTSLAPEGIADDAVPTPIEETPVVIATPGPATAPTGPWMQAPSTSPSIKATPAHTSTTPPAPAASGSIDAAAAAASQVAGRAVAPLPPGALPPGWAAFQQKAHQPAKPATAAPVAISRCDRCGSENPVTARFCGTCGNPMTSSAAAPVSRGKLILIRGISGEGRQFPLQPVNAAGRHDGTITFPDDPYLGSHHATFFFRGDDLLVKDEGSGNGVYVRLREAQPVKAGDMFVVGERLLRFAGPQHTQAPFPGRHGSPRVGDRLIALEELLEGGGTGRVCRRPGPIVTIGRAGCDLNFPQDGFVSARHAEVSIAGETAFLRDLGSANGTFLRVHPRTERKLTHGDYLLMGRELLRVEVAAPVR